MQKRITKYLASFFYLLLLVTVTVSVHSCTNTKSELETYFINDKRKIGFEISDQDLAVKFNAPKNWELKPASLSKKMESKSNSGEGFLYQPIYLFFDDSTGAILSAGKVTPNDSLINKGTAINFYKGFLASKYKNQNDGLATFSNNGISFSQIIVEKENLVSYKILFVNSKKDIIQFEYSFSKNESDFILPFIKASIGSIKNQ